MGEEGRELDLGVGALTDCDWRRPAAVDNVALLPAARLVGEVDLNHSPQRIALDAQLAQLALQAPDHHRFELLGTGDGHAAGESLRIEDFQERREAVRVAVVRGGREEQAMLELRRHLAHDMGDVGIDRILRRRRGCRRVRLVHDEQALGRALIQMAQERLAILGPAQRLVRNDEARKGRPGIDPEAALLAATNHEVAVVDLEADAEPFFHLGPPL